MVNEYSKLLYSEPKQKVSVDNYGSVFTSEKIEVTGKKKPPQKYHYVPYTEEERISEQKRQRRIVLSTLSATLVLLAIGFVPIVV